MTTQNMEEYAASAFREAVTNEVNGSQTAADIARAVEDVEPDFDGDSYCPYYSQHEEVISRYEDDFGNAADVDDGTMYRAREYAEARSAYAYGIAFEAFWHYLAVAKKSVIDGVSNLEIDAQEAGCTDPEFQVTSDCPHGWVAHTREDEDGTMFWENGVVEERNAVSRKIGGIWFTATWTPNEQTHERGRR